LVPTPRCTRVCQSSDPPKTIPNKTIPNSDLNKGKRMSKALDNLQTAQKRAMAARPKVGGFPYLAEVLRSTGVTKNLWILPSCQSLYPTSAGLS
jgi:hypothetical protein